MWQARGSRSRHPSLPTTLDQVAERHKDIQYSSKQRITNERAKEIAELRAALARLMDKLPAKLKADPDAKKLIAAGDDWQWTLLHLVNERLPHVSQTKDFEFSRATVNDHWDAGLEDVRRAAAHQDWLNPALCPA